MMNWTDRDPPGTDPLLQMTIPHHGGAPCRLEIDKLPDGRYRVTVGTLLEAQELCRTSDLELLLRHTYQLGVSRSFREVLAALQHLSELVDGRPAGSGERAVSQPAGPASARGHNRNPRDVAAGVIGRRFWLVKLRPASRLVRWL
jgi:hypothetical protein